MTIPKLTLFFTKGILPTAIFDPPLEIIISRARFHLSNKLYIVQRQGKLTGKSKARNALPSRRTHRKRPFESRTIPASGAIRTAYTGGIDRTLASVYYRFPKLISNSRGTSGTGYVGGMAFASSGVATGESTRLIEREGERTRPSSDRLEGIVRTGTIGCSVTREENANARVRQTASVGVTWRPKRRARKTTEW